MKWVTTACVGVLQRVGKLHSDEEWSSCVMHDTSYSRHIFHESVVTHHSCEDVLITERCKAVVRAWIDFVSWLYVAGHHELDGYACQLLHHVLSTCFAHSLSCFFSAITSAIHQVFYLMLFYKLYNFCSHPSVMHCAFNCKKDSICTCLFLYLRQLLCRLQKAVVGLW